MTKKEQQQISAAVRRVESGLATLKRVEAFRRGGRGMLGDDRELIDGELAKAFDRMSGGLRDWQARERELGPDLRGWYP